MKKKFCLTTFFSLIVLLLGGLFASNPFLCVKEVDAQAALASQVELTNSKTFLLVDGNPQGFDSQKVSASETSGYGRFKLNQQNVELKTQAKPGFVLVGWNVNALESGVGEQFYFNELNKRSDVVEMDGETFGGQPVTISFSYKDSDGDGYFDAGSFVISNIFSNMIVDPVFDYIYYNVDVSNIFNLTTCKNYTQHVVDANTTIYALSEENSVYSNSFVKNEKGVFYYGDIVLDGGKYYTAHVTDGVSQNVALERGAFRFDSEINLGFDIDKKEINDKTSTNIDVVNVIITEDEVDRPLSDAIITKDDVDRTSRVEFNFNIVATKNQLSTLSFTYNNLYLASFEIELDEGEDLSTQADYVEKSKNLILQNILVENAYYKLSDYSYWVKSSSGNPNGLAFRIFCNKSISGEQGVGGYYTFKNMQFAEDCQVDTTSQPIADNILQYANIVADFSVKIAYSSNLYQIDFQPYVLVNNSLVLIETEGFAVHETVENLVRGESRTFESSIPDINNVGYTFYGYTFDKTNISNQQTLQVTIDFNKPENQTVIMIYKYVNYTLQLSKYDSIELQNDGTKYFPLASLIVEVNGKNFASVNYNQLHPNANDNEKTYGFSGNLKIGDTVKISTVATAGFTINGFYVGEKQYLVNDEFVIDKDFIENYITSNIISVNVDEDYTLYTLTYFIEKIDISGVPTIMADIDTTWAKQDDVKKEEVDNQYKITISNLKYFDKVGLTSKGKEGYNFVRFTSSKTNFKAELIYTFEDASSTYSYEVAISGDEQIKVVYSTKKFNMQISVNYANAFDSEILNNYLEILQDDELVDIDENNTAQIDLRSFTIRFKTGQNPNFGFRLNAYNYHDKLEESHDYSVLDLQHPYSVEINPTSTENIKLTLMFDVIVYQISVYQFGNVYSGGQYKTLNNEPLFPDAHTINLNFNGNDLLEFNLAEGAYIKNFYFVKNTNRFNIGEFAQNNDSTSTIFSLKFSKPAAQNYCKLYGEEIEGGAKVNLRIDLVYELHEYAIKVDYNLISSKLVEDGLISYPLLQLEYNNLVFKTQVSSKTNQFINIPYGVSATISLLSNLPRGYLSISSWEKSNTTSDIAFYNTNSIIISKLIANENLIYSIEYSSYKIEVRVDGGFIQGKPIVEINGNTNLSRIENFDSFNIYMAANKINGFKFVRMFYFVDYVYNEETWNEDVKNLYVSDGLNFVKAEEEYDDGLNYAIRLVYDETEVYSNEKFNANDYALCGNSFIFIVEYDYIKIKITNTNMENEQNQLNNVGDLNILPQDYADFTIYKNGTLLDLTGNETVDYRDAICIKVQMKTVELGEEELGERQEFELCKGLILAYLNLNNVNFEYVGNGIYEVKFNVGDVIEYVIDERGDGFDGILPIEYYYGLEQIKVSVTTNVNITSFYYEGDVEKFKIFSSPAKGFGGEEKNTNKETTLNFDMQFLGVREISCQFIDALTKNNFEVKNAIFYRYIDDINTVEILPSQFKEFGITISTTDYFHINLRMLENLKVVLIVEPKIHFNNYNVEESKPDENYYLYDYLVYECDEAGNGKSQTLTTGVSGEGVEEDIQCSNLVSIVVNYYSIEIVNGQEIEILTDAIDAGRYRVKLSFDTSQPEFAWLKDVEINYNIELEIQRRPVSLICDPDSKKALQLKPITLSYNRTDTYRFDLLKEYLRIKYDDTLSFKIVLDGLQSNSIMFEFEDGITSIITDANGEKTYHASDSALNIYINNVYFSKNEFCKNFELINHDLTIESIIRINRAELTISGLSVYDKVEDGTNKAEYCLASDLKVVGQNPKDDVAILFDNLVFTFDGAEVGEHTVSMLADSSALIGENRNDYIIKTKEFSASIYPYSVETYVAGFGTITVFNERGKTEHDMVNLIPMDASLDVNVIYSDSLEYRNIYANISQYLSNRIVFAVGYRINFVVGGFSKQISPNLFVSLPNVERLNSAVWLADEQTGRINTNVQDGKLVLDLGEISVGLEGVIFTQNRLFLTWWQICLILLLILLIIALLVIIYIHERRKQKIKDELNEKI